MKNKAYLFLISVIVLSIAIGIIEWIILPDMVAMQIGAGGNLQNVVVKPIAILIPFTISIIGSIMYVVNKNKKAFIIALIGLLLPVFTIIINVGQ